MPSSPSQAIFDQFAYKLSHSHAFAASVASKLRSLALVLLSDRQIAFSGLRDCFSSTPSGSAPSSHPRKKSSPSRLTEVG